MVLQLTGVQPVLGVVGRVLVQVGHEDGLAVGRLDVLSGAAIAMAAGADFLIHANKPKVQRGSLSDKVCERKWKKLGREEERERERETYKVERAVDFVKLCAEDGGQEIGHFEDDLWIECVRTEVISVALRSTERRF